MATRRSVSVTHLACVAVGLAIGSLSAVAPRAAQTAPGARAQSDPGSEIAVLRYYKIRKGSFPEMYRLSVEGVWPYYERAGARVVGMWQVAYPALPGQTLRESAEYDEAYMMVR